MPSQPTSQASMLFDKEAPPPAPLSLWYRRPAPTWLHSLPVGNGFLGAMVSGGIEAERIQLNEKSLWSGSPQDADNLDALVALPEVRKLLFAGKYKEAEQLASKRMLCRGRGSGGGTSAKLPYGSYQTLGDLTLAFRYGDATPARVQEYRRELDLDEAVARTQFAVDGVKYSREVFASFPDRVLIVRLVAD